MKNIYLIISLFFLQTAYGETFYELNLKPGQWNVKPALFYIASVTDERPNKEKTGQALINNTIIPVRFKNSAEVDLFNFINANVNRDTTLIPLIFSIKKFEVIEKGTTANHKATFDFVFEISREINNKRYKIYDMQGKPELTMKGPYSNPHESNISEGLKSVFTGLNKWLNENPNFQPLARSAKVIVEQSRKYSGDTLAWSADYKLRWSDFMGTNPTGQYMAQSNCVFDYRLEPVMKNGIMELHLFLTSCFEKNNSWVKKGAQNDALLRHEQLHFDICELHIRKLRDEMVAADINPMEFGDVLNKLLEERWKIYQLDQQRYDAETEHGIVEKEQNRWEKEIEEKLRTEN